MRSAQKATQCNDARKVNPLKLMLFFTTLKMLLQMSTDTESKGKAISVDLFQRIYEA